MTQKMIAQQLDRAAARADSIDKIPATSKQCWYLASLMLQKTNEADLSELTLNTNLILTKYEASNRIGFYLSN